VKLTIAFAIGAAVGLVLGLGAGHLTVSSRIARAVQDSAEFEMAKAELTVAKQKIDETKDLQRRYDDLREELGNSVALFTRILYESGADVNEEWQRKLHLKFKANFDKYGYELNPAGYFTGKKVSIEPTR